MFSIWTLPGTPDDYEIKLPLDTDASGFPQRVKEAFNELEAAERRPQQRIFLDVQAWNCDAIRFGFQPRPEMEYLALGTMIEALENAQEILSALACSVIDPQPWFGKKRPREATEYSASLELSPFEEPLSLRILGRIESTLFAGNDDDFVPLTRRVSLKLRDAFQHLEALIHGLDRNADGDRLALSLQYGVTANVTESLVRLLKLPSAHGTKLEISLRLSPVRAFPGEALSVWQFRRSHLQTLGEIGERLKTFVVGPDERILFLVEAVKNSRRSRTITGTALIADSARRIEMAVDDELIQVAELAKRRNNAVQCFGRLRRRPDSGRFEILQPHDFQIVHSQDDPVVEELRRKLPASRSSGGEQLALRGEIS